MAALVAVATFHTPGRTVVEGESVESTDPVVSGREHLFAPADDAAPEKPETPAKKAPAKKAASRRAKADDEA